MIARCGTRAAIIAHLEFGEPLDGPCAAASMAMKLEAERHRPYQARWEDTPALCQQRRDVLLAAVEGWAQDHRGESRARWLRAV